MRLHTLDRIALMDNGAEIPLDEPRLAALVVVLAIAGDMGVSSDELLLLLTPGEKPDTARLELARLVAVARLRLGGESSIVQTGDRYAIARGLVKLDGDLRENDGSNECTAFLAGVKLPGSPEFQDWIAQTRRRVEPVVVR